MKQLFWLVSIFAACSGDTGPLGPPGTPGTNGTNGSNGSNGNNIILSERAKHGLDIAPVALDLTGLDGPGIERVGLGSYLVNAIADCSGCHNAPTGEYLGGNVQFVFDAAGDFVNSRNLTPDPTYGLKLTEAQFVETLQTGRDWHADQNGGNGLLFVMPWGNFRWLHTDDLKAIYAYLKVIPPAATTVSVDQKGTAAGALTPIPLPTVYDRGEQVRDITPETDFMGMPIPDLDGVVRGTEVSPLSDPNNYLAMDAATQARFGRGSYLVTAAACSDCHTNPPYGVTSENFLAIDPTQYLKGGGVFITPPGLGPVFGNQRSMSHNLIGVTNGFFNEQSSTYTRFAEIIITGTHVDDSPPRPLAWPMPYGHLRNMLTDDLVAVYTYLDTLAKQEPDTVDSNDKLTQGAAIWCDATHACPTGYAACNIDATFGNECVGNSCANDGDCGACQHCQLPAGTFPHAPAVGSGSCVAPDPANGADQACVATGI